MSDASTDCKYGFNYFKLHDPENSLQVKSYLFELEKCRMEDMKSVISSVNEVRRDLEVLKSQLSNNAEFKNMDYLKKNMFDIEEKISQLKKAIKEEFLTLLKNEVNLSKDLQLMEKRAEDWAKSVDVKIFKPIKHSSYKVKKTNEENPIVQFQKFLSRFGGHYGGWEEQDHLLFLKERAKYKNKDKLVSTLHCLLPDLSCKQIEEHESWYEKYEVLKDSQKKAIQNWKLEKETHQKKEEVKETKQEKPSAQKGICQRINIAERIKEWKKQQLLKRLEEEKQQKEEKKKLKQEEKKKQELLEMKKLAVQQYKAQKLSKMKQIFPPEENKQEAKAQNKILLKAFRLQDLKFIEKKKIIRLQIESKTNEKFERLKLAKPALEYILQRDPQRIFQPTLIWNQHCLESQKREKINPVFDLNSIPRLAIPEWRKELK